MSVQTDLLEKNGFNYQGGYVRFYRGEKRESLSTFQFHVREIRDMLIYRGEGLHKPTGQSVEVIRLHAALIGGQSLHTGGWQPERIDEMLELADAFLTLRNNACGLPECDYQVEVHQTTFYGSDLPEVFWDLPQPAE